MARISDQCDVRRVVAHGLIGIDVDAQQLAGNLEAAGEGHVVIGLGQLGADRQHHVGFGNQCAGGDQALCRTDQQRMAGRQHAFGVDGQRHRSVEPFGDARQLRRRVDSTAAGENQWPLRAGEQFAHAAHSSRCGAGAINIHRQAGEQFIGLFHQHVQRNFDMHRSWSPGLEQGKRTGQHHRQFGGRHQRMRERCDAADQCALVRQLMQLAAATAQLTTRLHAGDHQHGNRIGVGLAHGGGDIGHARAGDDETHTGFAAGARIAVGHEPGPLFVTRRDVVDA